MGEILLGVKWNPAVAVDDNDRGQSEGQLQVYIVEGAGMVDEDTHKPFNAFIKWYTYFPTHTFFSLFVLS